MTKKTEVFDIDALGAEFKPVVVRYHGTEYTLGESVDSILNATKVAGSIADDAPLEAQLAILPDVIRALNSALGEAMAESAPTVGERVALKKAVEEVMVRVTKVPFRPSK